MAAANYGKECLELRCLKFTTELALKDNDISATEVATPARGGRRVTLSEEVVSSDADFGEIVDMRVFGKRVAKRGEGSAAGDGGVGGETVAGGAAVGGGASGGVVGGGGFVGGRIRGESGPRSGP